MPNVFVTALSSDGVYSDAADLIDQSMLQFNNIPFASSKGISD